VIFFKKSPPVKKAYEMIRVDNLKAQSSEEFFYILPTTVRKRNGKRNGKRSGKEMGKEVE
jgi:hypothetical protein